MKDELTLIIKENFPKWKFKIEVHQKNYPLDVLEKTIKKINESNLVYNELADYAARGKAQLQKKQKNEPVSDIFLNSRAYLIHIENQGVTPGGLLISHIQPSAYGWRMDFYNAYNHKPLFSVKELNTDPFIVGQAK